MITVKDLWIQYMELLQKIAPDTYLALSPPISQELLDETEALYKSHNLPFPTELKEIYSITNGNNNTYACFGVYILTPIEYVFQQDVYSENSHWYKKDWEDDDPSGFSSLPQDYIKTTYLSKNWIPFSCDGTGGNLYLDLDPDKKGNIGQIIGWHCDEDTWTVFADSMTDFLMGLIIKLQTGDYQLDEYNEKRLARLTKNDVSTGYFAMANFGILDEKNDILGSRKSLKS